MERIIPNTRNTRQPTIIQFTAMYSKCVDAQQAWLSFLGISHWNDSYAHCPINQNALLLFRNLGISLWNTTSWMTQIHCSWIAIMWTRLLHEWHTLYRYHMCNTLLNLPIQMENTFHIIVFKMQNISCQRYGSVCDTCTCSSFIRPLWLMAL